MWSVYTTSLGNKRKIQGFFDEGEGRLHFDVDGLSQDSTIIVEWCNPYKDNVEIELSTVLSRLNEKYLGHKEEFCGKLQAEYEAEYVTYEYGPEDWLESGLLLDMIVTCATFGQGSKKGKRLGTMLKLMKPPDRTGFILEIEPDWTVPDILFWRVPLKELQSEEGIQLQLYNCFKGVANVNVEMGLRTEGKCKSFIQSGIKQVDECVTIDVVNLNRFKWCISLHDKIEIEITCNTWRYKQKAIVVVV